MRAIWMFSLLVVPTLAACVDGPAEPESQDPIVTPFPVKIPTFTMPTVSKPPSLALLEARNATGGTLWFSSTNLTGAANLTVGPDVARLLLYSNGTAYDVKPDGHLVPAVDNATSPVTFGARYAYPNPIFPVQLGTTCAEKTDGDVNCGLDEPSIIVDGRGWIYYTAACCFFVSSPVFVSKDHGMTFQNLANPYKDAYGNEGDLALDADGNLYYMDIDLATFGFARWNPDLSPAFGYRRPGEPLVDRPWIRAGSPGIVHAIYNTGSDTIVYRSTDYGVNFGALPVTRFGQALARGFGDSRGNVGMVGGGQFTESVDEGVTWSPVSPAEGCQGADTASYDEAGTLYFQGDGCVVARVGDAFNAPSQAIPKDDLDVYFTWASAGAPGAVAVAYYGAVKDDETAKANGLDPNAWYLFTSFSTDAASAKPHWATVLVDPEPLGYGQLGRRLGDFMQVAVGPDGAIHIAYAVNPEMDDSATATYIGTGPIAGMAPSKPLFGPFEA